jgi:hypothetical protein
MWGLGLSLGVWVLRRGGLVGLNDKGRTFLPSAERLSSRCEVDGGNNPNPQGSVVGGQKRQQHCVKGCA